MSNIPIFGDVIPEWDILPIANLGAIVTGNTPDTTIREYYDGVIPFVSPSDIGITTFIRSTSKTLSNVGFSKTRSIPKKAVMVVCIGSTIGKVGISNGECATNQQVNSVVCNAKNDSVFVFYCMLYLAPFIKLMAGTQAVPIINKTEFGSLLTITPPLPEQQKIAQILTSVDEVIEKTQAQIDKLKDLKTAMMQELLSPQENQGVCDENGKRHVEFKDSPVGRIPVGWEVKKLSEVFDLTSGSTPSRRERHYFSEAQDAIPWIKTLDMHDGLITTTDEKITKLAIENSSCKLLPIGTAVVAMYGGWNQIGRSGVLAIEATTNQAICALKPIGLVLGVFVNYWLISKRSIWKSVAASSRKDPNITKQDVSDFLVVVPSIKEQEDIVTRLDSLTSQVDNKKKLLGRYQAIKKALMQDLLTGKVRVNLDAHHKEQNVRASRTSTHAALAVS